jgi:hypothetical protein
MNLALALPVFDVRSTQNANPVTLTPLINTYWIVEWAANMG